MRHPAEDHAVRAVDLFCGGGGLGLGLQQAGMECVAAIDNDPIAISVRIRNGLDGEGIVMGLEDVEAATAAVGRFGPGLVAGGPPCQDFSMAGLSVEGERADLTVAFARIAVGCGADFALMENVPPARWSRSWAAAEEVFRRAGWAVVWCVVNAGWYGVPQNRRRFLALAWRAPGEIGGAWLERMLSRRGWRIQTVREAVPDIGFDHYYRHPVRAYDKRGVFSVDEPAPTVTVRDRPVPPGYRRHPADEVDPSEVRTMTFGERSRVQGFPIDWVWQWPGGPGPERAGEAPGPARTHVDRLIGNAVPPPLARAMGRALLEAAA